MLGYIISLQFILYLTAPIQIYWDKQIFGLGRVRRSIFLKCSEITCMFSHVFFISNFLDCDDTLSLLVY